jgi:hypothetical protein
MSSLRGPTVCLKHADEDRLSWVKGYVLQLRLQYHSRCLSTCQYCLLALGSSIYLTFIFAPFSRSKKRNAIVTHMVFWFRVLQITSQSDPSPAKWCPLTRHLKLSDPCQSVEGTATVVHWPVFPVNLGSSSSA